MVTRAERDRELTDSIDFRRKSRKRHRNNIRVFYLRARLDNVYDHYGRTARAFAIDRSGKKKK